VTTTN